MLPTQQGFHADNPVVRDVELRLIVQHEMVGVDAVTQLGDERETVGVEAFERRLVVQQRDLGALGGAAATFARRIISDASSPMRPLTRPTAISAVTATPPRSTSVRRPRRKRSITDSEDRRSVPGSTMPNSSPPVRARRSPSRTAARPTVATCSRNRSPFSCPRISLIWPKPSTSMTTTDTGRPPSISSVRLRYSAIEVRLASPVSVSVPRVVGWPGPSGGAAESRTR